MKKTIIQIENDPSRKYLKIDGHQLGEQIVKTEVDTLKWAKKQLKKRTQVSITNISRLEEELDQWKRELEFLEIATENIKNNNFKIL